MPTPQPPIPHRAEFAAQFAMHTNEPFLEAVVSACALVAYADGWVTPEERDRLLGIIRTTRALSVFPSEDVVQSFEEVTALFDRDPEQAEAQALERVAAIAGQLGRSRLLVTACCVVAMADTQLDGEERSEILRICGLLRLNPANFDLMDTN